MSSPWALLNWQSNKNITLGLRKPEGHTEKRDEIGKKTKSNPGLQNSLTLLKTQLTAPQPQQPSPSTSSSSHFSSTSDGHLLPLLRGTRSNSEATWDFEKVFNVCSFCQPVVTKSIIIGTDAFIFDSHWVHYQLLAINSRISWEKTIQFQCILQFKSVLHSHSHWGHY